MKKIKKVKKKQLPIIFALKKVKLNRGSPKPIGTDEDQTTYIYSSIKAAAYSKRYSCYSNNLFKYE